MELLSDAVERLTRWEDAGGTWRLLDRAGTAVTVSLRRCDGGEEVDRLVSTDQALITYLAGRTSSEDPPRDPNPGHRPSAERDRDLAGRARQARPRDRLGRPLPYGAVGVEPVSEEPLPPLDTLLRARALLAEGRPFSAHEVLEARWKAGPDAERDLWQGLAQLCVGITHAERGNRVGAQRLLDRSRRRLAAYVESGGPRYGLDLSVTLDWIGRRLGEPPGADRSRDQPF